MKNTRIYLVDLDRLQHMGRDGALVICLMMALNDLDSANWAAEYFKQRQPKIPQRNQDATRRYFILLQCGHVYEAMELLKEMEKRDQLLKLLSRCSPPTQDAYRRLQEYLPGGSQRKQFETYLKSIRNRVAFHYNAHGHEIEKAMVNCPGRYGLSRRRSMLTIESDNSGLRSFGVADDILDTIIVQHWQALQKDDIQAEIDRVADFGAGIAMDFVRFGRELTTRFIRENACAK